MGLCTGLLTSFCCRLKMKISLLILLTLGVQFVIGNPLSKGYRRGHAASGEEEEKRWWGGQAASNSHALPASRPAMPWIGRGEEEKAVGLPEEEEEKRQWWGGQAASNSHASNKNNIMIGREEEDEEKAARLVEEEEEKRQWWGGQAASNSHASNKNNIMIGREG